MTAFIQARLSPGAIAQLALRCEWQFNPDACPAARVVVGDCPPAMSGSDRGHDRQPEPGAAVRAHARGIGAAKAFEGPRQELRRKSRPFVSDLDRQHAPRAAAATVAGHFARIAGHLDDAAIRGMPDRIVDEAAQRLPQPVRISEGSELVPGLHRDFDAAASA